MVRKKLGFKQSFEYILDLLCYAYYVKHDNLISDIAFDELERVYCVLTGEETAPRKSREREVCYTYGVKSLYDEYKKKVREKKFKILDDIKAKLPDVSEEKIEKDVTEAFKKIKEEE